MHVSGVNQSCVTIGSNDLSTDEQNADSAASSSGAAQGSGRQRRVHAASPNGARGNGSARGRDDAGNHLQRTANDTGGTHEAQPNRRTGIALPADLMTNYRANLHAGQHACAARDVSTLSTGVVPAPGKANARNENHLGSVMPTALQHADESGNHGPRVKRGPALSRCIMDRGGDALAQNAVASERFDQRDYPETADAGRGLCGGMVREVMRRIDRAWSDQQTTTGSPNPPSSPLRSAVHDMRADAGASVPRRDMFGRIASFQIDSTTLGYSHYAPRPSITFKSSNEPRDSRISRFVVQMHSLLRNPNDIAHVQLSLESPTHKKDYGHAILIQMGRNNHYTIFDPNNGAFEYANWGNTEQALNRYLDSAFRIRSPFDELPSFRPGREYQVMPLRLQAYSPTPHANHTPARALAPQQGSAGYGPPEPDCEGQIYREHAASSNGLSLDTLFPGGAERSGLRSPAESLGSFVLRQVTGGVVTTLSGATNSLRGLSSNAGIRANFVERSNYFHGYYQWASTTDLANHIRHSGSDNIRTEDDLVSDLTTHFGEPYVSDSAPVPLRNDFVVIDLSLNPQAAGTSRRDPSRPIVVQRLNVDADVARDHYELYDPNFGAYTYNNFQDLSAAIRRIYATGYSADAGINHATTTWFAREAGIVTSSGRPPARDVSLAQLEQMGGPGPIAPLVPPRANLPAAPADNRPSLQDYVQHVELKRSSDSQSTTDPWVLFRPSTDTPNEVAKRGGFSAGNTPLRDVDLQMHNFDIASHDGETDSAGYLGTFGSPSAAIRRQRSQSADGYIYAVAPSPNMVSVDASLGRHTLKPENLEFAAMGYIDNTQILGWWRTQDLQQKGGASNYTLNPSFRWDVYGRTQTAGAQPQLARFPMSSPAWQEPAYKPFSSPVTRNGQQVGVAPKQDPNLTQAKFYLNAREKVHWVAIRQSAGKDYHGPTTLRAYGGQYPYILYADGQNNLYVYSESYASSTAGSTRQFSMGEDGRFHFANDYNKVLRVGHDDYLYVGAIPTDSQNLNGVFRHAGTNPSHLVHAEDGKYLTVGKSVATPFVTDYDAGYRSSWQLADPRGNKVTLPASNKNYHLQSTAGTREQLYEFDQDPDSMLPPGTTEFVTRLPLETFQGKFMDYIDYIQRTGTANQVIQELLSNNAAWIFPDGFYAVPTSLSRLEVRTLGGKPVWQATVNLDNGSESYQPLISGISSNFRINDDVWSELQSREKRGLELEDNLLGP
ncbi:enterotoxin A family protein [Paraburkholderia aromaticivorans]|uniref:enterotoxin A family protein n=1 Tax=Paraburkholderia aromaticivorans TaxID=2026199 RepID=UPI00145607FE|nr:enterotoxin A family protein [Paraburkholderia aromaticivorans]